MHNVFIINHFVQFTQTHVLQMQFLNHISYLLKSAHFDNISHLH